MQKKKFFAPFYLEQSLFEKWNPQRNLKYSINQNEAIGQFKAALEAQGFIIDTPIMNGKIQRCKIDGDRGNEKSGAYVGFLDEYPAGFIQNHKTGFKENWKFQLPDKNNQIQRSTQNKSIDNNLIKQKQKEREAQLTLLQKKTAIFKKFLKRKNLKSLTTETLFVVIVMFSFVIARNFNSKAISFVKF